jgi:hypothetical protein
VAAAKITICLYRYTMSCRNLLAQYPSISVCPELITSQNAVVTVIDAMPLPEDPYLGYH